MTNAPETIFVLCLIGFAVLAWGGIFALSAFDSYRDRRRFRR